MSAPVRLRVRFQDINEGGRLQKVRVLTVMALQRRVCQRSLERRQYVLTFVPVDRRYMGGLLLL
jgi:hypothetical protein